MSNKMKRIFRSKRMDNLEIKIEALERRLNSRAFLQDEVDRIKDYLDVEVAKQNEFVLVKKASKE